MIPKHIKNFYWLNKYFTPKFRSKQSAIEALERKHFREDWQIKVLELIAKYRTDGQIH